MDEMTVVWSGSMRDVYLCVREPEFGKPTPIPKHENPYRDLVPLRLQILAALEEQPTWAVKDLRYRCGVDSITMSTQLRYLVRFGQLRRVSYGVVAAAGKAA